MSYASSWTRRGGLPVSASDTWAYLPSRIATIRPPIPSRMRSIATFANVVATIESSMSGSPERRS